MLHSAMLAAAWTLGLMPVRPLQNEARTIPVSTKRIRFKLDIRGVTEEGTPIGIVQTEGAMARVTVDGSTLGISPYIVDPKAGTVSFMVFEIKSVAGSGESVRQLESVEGVLHSHHLSETSKTKYVLRIEPIEILEGAPRAH